MNRCNQGRGVFQTTIVSATFRWQDLYLDVWINNHFHLFGGGWRISSCQRMDNLALRQARRYNRCNPEPASVSCGRVILSASKDLTEASLD